MTKADWRKHSGPDVGAEGEPQWDQEKIPSADAEFMALSRMDMGYRRVTEVQEGRWTEGVLCSLALIDV